MVLELIDDFEHLKDGEPSRFATVENESVQAKMQAADGGVRMLHFRGEKLLGKRYVSIQGSLAAQFKFNDSYVLVTEFASDAHGKGISIGHPVKRAGQANFYVLTRDLELVARFYVPVKRVYWSSERLEDKAYEQAVNLIGSCERWTVNNFSFQLTTGHSCHLQLVTKMAKHFPLKGVGVVENHPLHGPVSMKVPICVYRRYRLRWPRVSDFLTLLSRF